MYRHIAMKWADELESGKHIQGKELMHYRDTKSRETRKCCLGVLCSNVLNISCRQIRDEHKSWIILYEYGSEGCLSGLPQEAIDKAGLWSSYGSFKPRKVLAAKEDGSLEKIERFAFSMSLANMNDSGWSFPMIAKVIRDYYKDL